MHLLVHRALKEKRPDVILHAGSWLRPGVRLDGQGLGRTVTGKMMTWEFGEEVCGQVRRGYLCPV